MIAFLKGKIHSKSAGKLILDVRDVGYLLEISNQTFSELPAEGETVEILVHHHITDNDQRLFGFLSDNEKDLFELLITVKGVGPKLGLTILSGLPAEEITGAILRNDKTALSQISGIGRKTAERMILELKDKMPEMLEAAGATGEQTPSGNLKKEAASALQSLGFKKRDAEQAVSIAVRNRNGDENVQDIVKKALSHLNK